MKRFAPLAGLFLAALLGGCAVYPDGTPMYGNGYGAYDGYDGYLPGGPVVPQTNVYMGYGNYSAPGYDGGPGRYYGPGPGYRGYPDHGRPNHGNEGNRDGGGANGGRHGPPNGGPPAQGALGGPRGPSGSNAPHPAAGGPPPSPPPQAGGGGRGSSGGGGEQVRGASGHHSGEATYH
jgi:hypothetical protein